MRRSSIATRIKGVFFIDLVRNDDGRGWLTELYRSDHLDPQNMPAMGYVSQTLPGVVRGPHEHEGQTDLFCFVGPADFELVLLEKTSGREERHIVGESRPVSVAVPPGVIHSYRNISGKPGLVLNFPNRLYGGPGRCYPVDEIRHEDAAESVVDTFFV